MENGKCVHWMQHQHMQHNHAVHVWACLWNAWQDTKPTQLIPLSSLGQNELAEVPDSVAAV